MARNEKENFNNVQNVALKNQNDALPRLGRVTGDIMRLREE
jgi:hypothetical protein